MDTINIMVFLGLSVGSLVYVIVNIKFAIKDLQEEMQALTEKVMKLREQHSPES